jgi:hypothetical protein
MHCTILSHSITSSAQLNLVGWQFRGPFAFKIRSDFCVPPCVRQIGALADKAAGDKAGT